jgi:hypothetical protein
MACGGHVYWRIGTKWAIFILFVISAIVIHTFYYSQRPHSFKPHRISLCTRYWTPGLFVISAFFIHAFFYIQTPHSFKPCRISLCTRYWTPCLFFRWWSLIFSFILYFTIRHYTVLNIIKTVGKYSDIRNVSMGDL